MTRGLRRARGVATGIDRVESAYLSKLLTLDRPIFGLARHGRREWLLSRAGLQALAGGDRTLDRAIDRCLGPAVDRMFARRLPSAAPVFLSVGHAVPRRGLLWALMQRPESRLVFLLHDAIPLTHPELQTRDARRRHDRLLGRLSRRATHLIYPSAAARTEIEADLRCRGRCPPGTVAPLGVAPPPAASCLPPGIPDVFFLCLGTLEPRKNQGFLLDLWVRMASDPRAATPCPALVLAGAKGWQSPGFFTRLQTLIDRGINVVWLRAPPDEVIGALLRGARAVLHPSLTEGFGLPPAEAVAVGTPVVSAPVAATEELLGNRVRVLPLSRPDLWIDTIRNASANPGFDRPVRADLPDWDRHFKTVLSLLD